MDIPQYPQSQEAETVVLGSILLDPKEAAEKAFERVTETHFYKRSHQIIFKAIHELFKANKPIEIPSLTDALKSSGNLEEVGGAFYISTIVSAFPTAAHISHYLDVLIEKHKRRRLLEVASNVTLKAHHEDLSSLLQETESSIFSLSEAAGMNENKLSSAASSLQKEIDQIKSGVRISGIPTGISSFDKAHGGLLEGRYYAIAARPNVGKTSFAIQICNNLVLRDVPVLFITLEMTEERLLGRMAANIAGVNYFHFLKRSISSQDLLRLETSKKLLERKPLILINPVDTSGIALRSIIRRYARTHGVKLVVLDYLQNIDTSRAQDERIAFAQASSQMQKAAIECKISVFVLSQLNRKSDDQARPKLSNLKETGKIEQDADSVLMLWPETDPSGHDWATPLPVVMSIEKNRDGPKGDQVLLFDGPTMTFREKTYERNDYVR